MRGKEPDGLEEVLYYDFVRYGNKGTGKEMCSVFRCRIMYVKAFSCTMNHKHIYNYLCLHS